MKYYHFNVYLPVAEHCAVGPEGAPKEEYSKEESEAFLIAALAAAKIWDGRVLYVETFDDIEGNLSIYPVTST